MPRSTVRDASKLVLVYKALQRHGAATNKQLAERTGLEYGATQHYRRELVRLGGARMAGKKTNNQERFYEALSDWQAPETSAPAAGWSDLLEEYWPSAIASRTRGNVKYVPL